MYLMLVYLSFGELVLSYYVVLGIKFRSLGLQQAFNPEVLVNYDFRNRQTKQTKNLLYDLKTISTLIHQAKAGESYI